MSDIISYSNVESKIIEINGQKVILDRDVAELYGVETKEINQAVRNNPDKFPEGYTITVDTDTKHELVKNFDHLSQMKFSKVVPKAFTEKGLYMLATILKSQVAVQTTIAIIEAFAKLRELSSAVSQLPAAEDESQQKLLMRRSGEILMDILGDDVMSVSGDETTIELDLAFVKLKRTVKREKK